LERTFAAAQRVVDRVHRLGARVRAVAHVALPAGLADVDVDPVEVAELADGRAALALHAAHFAAGKNDDRPLAFLGPEACDAAGAADKLPSLARVHLDVVNLKPPGTLLSGIALPSSGGASGPLITFAPTRRPLGARMYAFSPSAYWSSAM
jgi:hypothetical protein